MRALRSLLADDRGQATTEYVLIIGVIVVILLNLAILFSDQIRTLLDWMKGQLTRWSQKTGMDCGAHDGRLPRNPVHPDG
jgi:Flp pilus assembly pilin Flp